MYCIILLRMAQLEQQEVKKQGLAEGYLLMQREQERKKTTYPLELQQQRLLERRDPTQTFYRYAQKLNTHLTLRKLGWKVIELRREQQDIALCCFSLLQAESQLSLKIFSISRRVDRSSRLLDLQTHKEIWMETQIILSDSTHNEQDSTLQLAAYRFCEALLALLRNFSSKYLSWDYMSDPDFDDSKVVHLFREEIMEKLPQLAAAHRRREK